MRKQLDRILSSRGFASAGRISRLLRYTVEKALAGQTDQLKEYSVGVEVFDRDQSYDPRIDSIVRVEAGRLRSRLDEYYNGDGAADEIRITLPRGGYVPQFERRSEHVALVPAPAPAPALAPAPSPARAPALAPALTAALICAVGVMVVWLGGWGSRPIGPSVAVLAFEEYSPAEVDTKLAAQLTDLVTAELARLNTIGVVSHTSARQFKGVRKPLREIASALNASFIMEASMDRQNEDMRIVARLVDATTDRKMWVRDYRVPPGNADLRDLSRTIAADVSAAVLARR